VLVGTGSKDDDLGLPGGEGPGQLDLSLPLDVADSGVVSGGVVVEQGEALDAPEGAHLDGILPGAMTPADAGRAPLSAVLGAGVLGVVDEQVSAGCKRDQPLVQGVAMLDIGGEYHAATAGADPEHQDAVGVGHLRALHLEGADLERMTGVEVEEVQGCGECIETDRELGWSHLAAQAVLDSAPAGAGPAEGDARAGVEERGEEGHPLDMIPVDMGEEQGGLDGGAAELLAEGGQPGPPVEDEPLAILLEHHAGGIATGSGEGGAADGDATPDPLESNSHWNLLVQRGPARRMPTELSRLVGGTAGGSIDCGSVGGPEWSAGKRGVRAGRAVLRTGTGSICDNCGRRNPIHHWLPLLGLVLALLGPVAHAQQPDADLAWATFRQDVAVGWDARREGADRRSAAREALFSGSNSFVDAFPELVGARLSDPAVVRARLGALQDRATAREAERQEPLPPLGDPDRLAEAGAIREAMLAAEDRADGYERRLLTGVSAYLQRNPGLTDAALEGLRAPLLEVLGTKPDSTDPAQQAALDAKIAAADADLAALAQLQRAVMLHAVLGRPLPPIDAELNRLEDPVTAPMAAERLRLLRPWLQGEAADRLDSALAAYSSGPALQRAREAREAAAAELAAVSQEPADRSVDQCTAELHREQMALERVEARLAGLPEGSPSRDRVALDRDAQVDRVAAARIRLQRAQGVRDEGIDQATAAADRARKQADEAAASAADDEQRAQARFLSQGADARDRVAEAESRIEQRRVGMRAREEQLAQAESQYRDLLSEIENASPIPGTGPDADGAYQQIRSYRAGLIDGDVARGVGVYQAQERVAELRANHEQEQATIAEGLRVAGNPTLERAARDWRAALDKEMQLAEEEVALAKRERQAVLTSLQAISELRRVLRGYVSWSEREADRRELGSDVGRELALLGPTILARIANRFDELGAVPGRLFRDATLLLDLMWGLFWTIVLLGGWSWARGKSPEIAFRLALQLKRLRPEMRPIDIQRLKAPATDAVRASIDLALGYLMVGRISQLSPEIAFLVETWLLLAIYRALLGLFDLGVVRAPEFRPSLLALAPESYDLLRLTTRVFLVWGIARGFAYYVFWSMLQLDTITGLLMTLFSFIFVGLSIYLLYHWDPILRVRIRARNQESKLVAFLSREVPSPLRPLSAVGLLAFFVLTLGVDFLYVLVARDRTGLARVFNVMARYQMGADADPSVVPIPDEAMEKLCSRDSKPNLYVPRPDVDEALTEAFSGWKKEGRRGMVALVGDRGEGKRTEIGRFLNRCAKEELPTERFRMTTLVSDEKGVLGWVAEVTGAEYSGDAEGLVESLRELPPGVFVLEQAHRCFSRSVGGFGGISAFLYVLNATSDHHFWLVSFHQPAWHYLCAIPSIVDVGVFRSVALLNPFDGPRTREITERRSRYAGLELDYRGLMRANLLGADPEVELERSINAFYRLLAEASEGNPRVALHLFAACLEPGERAGVARVLTRAALRTEVASDLSVDALFTLTALRQQDLMALDDLVEVTNLPVHTVRNTVRDLQSRGLVENANSQVYIPIQKLPMVSRTLRRRHLLHLGA